MADTQTTDKSGKKSLIVKIIMGIVIIALLVTLGVFIKQQFSTHAVTMTKTGGVNGGRGGPQSPTGGASSQSPTGGAGSPTGGNGSPTVRRASLVEASTAEE